MYRHLLRAGMAFTLALVVTGCWGSPMTIHTAGAPMNRDGNRNKIRETVRKQFVAEKVNALRVRGDAGDIRVTAGAEDTKEIAIRAEKSVEGARSVAELKMYLARAQVTTHLEGDTLIVEADYPRKEFSRHHIGVAINYVITLPKRLMLDLQSDAGEVEVKGAKGGVRAHSDAGNVTLADVAGTIEAASDAGEVTVAGARVTGLLKLNSDAGNVRAKAIRGSGSALKVMLKSGSGDVDFEGDAGELDLRSDAGNVSGKVTGALTLSRADLHSGSGNVALTAPKTLSATIQAKTDTGNIQMHGTPHANRNVDNDGAGQSLKFTLGGGSAPVTLETNSGNVEFRVE